MVSKYKIVHEREECIGCGACASVNPTYWEMKNDGKSSIIGGKSTGNGEEETITLEKDFESNNDAAESCPVNCIHIFEITKDKPENKII